MRRPLSSTSVDAAPSPRSEIPEAPEAKPPPKFFGTEPWLSTASVCSSSATLAWPDLSMSWRVSVCTGDAVSELMRRMLEPVISTRSRVCGVSCATAEPALSKTPPHAAISPVQSFVLLMVTAPRSESLPDPHPRGGIEIQALARADVERVVPGIEVAHAPDAIVLGRVIADGLRPECFVTRLD